MSEIKRLRRLVHRMFEGEITPEELRDGVRMIGGRQRSFSFLLPQERCGLPSATDGTGGNRPPSRTFNQAERSGHD